MGLSNPAAPAALGRGEPQLAHFCSNRCHIRFSTKWPVSEREAARSGTLAHFTPSTGTSMLLSVCLGAWMRPLCSEIAST